MKEEKQIYLVDTVLRMSIFGLDLDAASELLLLAVLREIRRLQFRARRLRFRPPILVRGCDIRGNCLWAPGRPGQFRAKRGTLRYLVVEDRLGRKLRTRLEVKDDSIE